MQLFATRILTAAALAAGLAEGRVMEQSAKDNLTIVRPRLELQFLPEQYTRSGRKLGVYRTKTELVRKRELYVVRQEVAAHVLADDRAWLEAFCYDFAAALPAGGNDSRGNWVQIRAEQARFSKDADKRVGTSVIEVFTKVNRLFNVAFTWRISAEEAERLILSYTINPAWKGIHDEHEKEPRAG